MFLMPFTFVHLYDRKLILEGKHIKDGPNNVGVLESKLDEGGRRQCFTRQVHHVQLYQAHSKLLPSKCQLTSMGICNASIPMGFPLFKGKHSLFKV